VLRTSTPFSNKCGQPARSAHIRHLGTRATKLCYTNNKRKPETMFNNNFTMITIKIWKEKDNLRDLNSKCRKINECTSDCLKNNIKIYIKIAPACFGAVTPFSGGSLSVLAKVTALIQILILFLRQSLVHSLVNNKLW